MGSPWLRNVTKVSMATNDNQLQLKVQIVPKVQHEQNVILPVMALSDFGLVFCFNLSPIHGFCTVLFVTPKHLESK